MLTKKEFLLVIVGGIFVVEAAVGHHPGGLLQAAPASASSSWRPIHHHFELKGWAEPKVIVRFWIISIMLALLALGTLKLR